MKHTEFLAQPLFFDPIYKEKIWGGQNLRSLLSRNLPPDSPIGESWELSGWGEDISRATTAAVAGRSLRELLKCDPSAVLGTTPQTTDFFPLLYKFIDANDRLSVQVHPDDDQAAVNNWGYFGKTESWYVADAKPGAQIIVGFKDGVSPGDVENGIRDVTLDQLLNFIDIRKGDVLFVPAGTVHAILGDTVIYEVQESSDTTFRLYDWGRKDQDGKSRPLHVAQALEVLDTAYHEHHNIPPVALPGDQDVQHSFRVACGFFAVEEYVLRAGARVDPASRRSFQVATVLEGGLQLSYQDGSVEIGCGQTVLIPAKCRSLAVSATSPTRFLLSCVPDLEKEVVAPLRDAGIPDQAIAALGGNPMKNDIAPLL